MNVLLKKSPNKNKKWRVTLPNGSHVNFGASGYQDYTMHHDPKRKELYKIRHKARENWTMEGINKAGFWSRWLLWEKPTMAGAKKFMKTKFGISLATER